jgi:hypothetical protein
MAMEYDAGWSNALAQAMMGIREIIPTPNSQTKKIMLLLEAMLWETEDCEPRQNETTRQLDDSN